MSDESRPIIVKRVKRRASGASHGGAWKIAYADFVTAMMAFFLLMWLLGSTTQGDLEGIAEYFRQPLKVALAGGKSSGESATVLQGGGRDLTRRGGQVPQDGLKRMDLKTAQAEVLRHEFEQITELKRKLEHVFDGSTLLKQFKNQILLDITDEGLRIQIVDEKNRPMFDTGSALLLPHTREILREIGRSLNGVNHKISLSGHTDATPFVSRGSSYGNWELSADRANASRRELIAGGMDEAKVLRVVGLASAVLLDKSDPYNPINRRISLVVLNKKTEDSMSRDESKPEAPSTRITQGSSGSNPPAK